LVHKKVGKVGKVEKVGKKKIVPQGRKRENTTNMLLSLIIVASRNEKISC
jgi:hypothetical protein